MFIEEQIIRIQKVTPTFTLEKEMPIVLVWVSLLELPWHCNNKEFILALFAPIGKTLYLYAISIQKIRGSVVKVRMQLDVTKERPPHVWMDPDETDYTNWKVASNSV